MPQIKAIPFFFKNYYVTLVAMLTAVLASKKKKKKVTGIQVNSPLFLWTIFLLCFYWRVCLALHVHIVLGEVSLHVI